jgi:NAD(P)-dependent dehydrogenase (short-subunit alcohol dehydrogenase family)
MDAKRPQIVVITGGTAGVGRATSRRFAVDGAHIALLARGSDGLEATAREIFALGGRALAIPTDVGIPSQMFDAAERIEAELGPVDIWINNAMTTVFARVDQLSPYELKRVTDVTYHGYVWGTQAALRSMRPRDRGTIVQVGSALSYRSIPLQAAYCAAKHAVVGFTDAVRCELAHDHAGIDITVVHLPAVNTPQFTWCENKLGVEAQPVPPIFQPEVAAEAIHFAAHHPKRETLVALPTIQAVIGHKLAPGLLDRILGMCGYHWQTTGKPLEERPSNLFAPIAGDHGAHGPFELRARRRSLGARVGSWLGAAGVQAVAVVAALGLVLGATRLAR